MGKRNLRILPAAFATGLPKLKGKEIHVFRMDGTIYAGILYSENAQHIELKDKGGFWYNFRKKIHSIPLSEIREVMYDYVTEW